jgi:hypothetical protein
MKEQAFDFSRVGFGMLSADPFAGNVARQLVQTQRDGQPLFARHQTVAFNLFVQRGGRSHGSVITEFSRVSIFLRFLRPGVLEREGATGSLRRGAGLFSCRAGPAGLLCAQ